MPGLNKNYFQRLYAIADGQNGYFTARQALKAGYSHRMQIYHVNNEDWERCARGIFRFTNYPPDEQSDLLSWYLWSCDRNDVPQGVFSHDTALAIYSLGTWRSRKIHMIVPRNFRREIIPKSLHLYRENLKESDWTKRHFVKVTTPLKTFIDLIDSELSLDFIEEALKEAVDKQLIDRRAIDKAQLTTKQRKQFEILLKRIENEQKKVRKPIRFSKGA